LWSSDVSTARPSCFRKQAEEYGYKDIDVYLKTIIDVPVASEKQIRKNLYQFFRV